MCASADPRDNRLRASALLSVNGTNILIDAGPDLRQQMLRARVKHVDAILLTHEHNDHVIGLDDIRPFNFNSGRAMAVYALPRVVGQVRRRFDYVFGDPIPGLPQIELLPIEPETALFLAGQYIQPIGVMHGGLPILGFRIGDLAYLTDVKTITAPELKKIEGIRYLVVSALHHNPHPTHMNLQEALIFVDALKPEHAWLTHVSHNMGLAADMESQLPSGVSFAYDGLEIEF